MNEEQPPKTHNLADDQIQKAMEDGAFDNLAGEGKPFNFEQDRFVPTENRLAYRIMRDNNIQPEWIMLQKEIDHTLQTARQTLYAAARQYTHLQTQLAPNTDTESILRRIRARDDRDDAQQTFRQQIHKLNQKITEFNLKVPFSHLTRDLVDAEREISQAFG